MGKLLIARPGDVYLATYAPLSNQFTILHDLALPGCPSWLGLDKPRSLLYIIDEDSSRLHRVHLETTSTTPFTQTLTVDTASPGAVHLAFSHDRQRLLGAAFGSGAVNVWDDAPHPHQVLPDPTGRFSVVPDLCTDELLVINSKDEAFTLSGRISVAPPGNGPRHGAFYPVGASTATHYVLLCELTSTVVVYALSYTDSGLEFTRLSDTCTLNPADASVSTAQTGHLELLPDNRHLHVSNRLTGRAHDSIAYMRIHADGEHPTLELWQDVLTLGTLARMFCVLNGGRGDILVANENSEFGLVLLGRTQDGRINNTPKLCVPMSEFINEVEIKKHPGRGPKFVMEV